MRNVYNHHCSCDLMNSELNMFMVTCMGRDRPSYVLPNELDMGAQSYANQCFKVKLANASIICIINFSVSRFSTHCADDIAAGPHVIVMHT